MTYSELTVLACANQWAFPGLNVALFSCLKNISTIPHFLILHQELTEADFELVKKNLNSTNKKYSIEFVELDKSLFVGLRPGPNESMLPYARLWADIFCKESKWLIYIDCDTVVHCDVTALISSNDNFAFSAVVDSGILDLEHSPDVDTQKLNLDGKLPYFNSGFLKINMNACRKAKLFEKARGILFQDPQSYRYHDQTVLNILFAGKWEELQPKWNDQLWLTKGSPRYSSYLNSIIHTPGAVKLWMVSPINAQGIVKLFYKYYDSLPCSPVLSNQKFCYLPSVENQFLIKLKVLLRTNPAFIFRVYRRIKKLLNSLRK